MIDRQKFAVHLFYTGLANDEETAAARNRAESFVTGPKALHQWVEAIEAVGPDAILYPEIGMDTLSAKLAAMRLCPLQLAAWGHPITTGLPTIDYFLSAARFEPEEAHEHYREQLSALPNLGCCYTPLTVKPEDVDLAQWGVDVDTPVLVCAGTPYKYAPSYDRIYVEIARGLGRAKFVFFRDSRERLSQLLLDRLKRTFEDEGLDASSFLVLIPRQTMARFFGVMRRADVYLDTMGFSGFNTAMQAVECALPIVTNRGRFMRGRLASGILDRMGMSDLIAETETEYVDLAVRLCQDKAFRMHVRERMEHSRRVLFNDQEPIRALEKLLVKLVRK